nr:hypothetical protein [Gordonia sp. NB41Y]EMP10606.1 hypothetical protein ISGA_3298 [Gordonia sp. NB41Y]
MAEHAVLAPHTMVEQDVLAPQTMVDFDKLNPTDQDVLALARPTVRRNLCNITPDAPTSEVPTFRHRPAEISTRVVATLLHGSISKNHTPHDD